MQRPVEFGERAVLTDGEYAKREAQSAAQAKADTEQFVRSGGGRGGGVGPPDHWLERGRPSRQASLIVDPPNGRLPALTPAAEKFRKEARGGRGLTGEWRGVANWSDDLNIYYRCITRGLLGSMIPVIYGNSNEIVQAPGYVVIRNEMIHESRVIPTDGRPHVSPNIRMYMGDSRGHWEGDSLVIETTNLTDKVPIGSNGAGYAGDPGYHSRALRLTERITRTGDDTLVPRHGRRCGDVDEAVDAADRADTRRGAAPVPSTRATRAITRCRTSSAAPAPTRRTRSRRRPDEVEGQRRTVV